MHVYTYALQSGLHGDEEELLHFLQLNALLIPDQPRFTREASFPFLRGGVGKALPGCGGGVCAVPSCGGKFMNEVLFGRTNAAFE